MKPIKKKRFLGLEAIEDENLNAMLIYGQDRRKNRKCIVCWYRPEKGVETFYHLRSVLEPEQIDWIREELLAFNKKAEVQI